MMCSPLKIKVSGILPHHPTGQTHYPFFDPLPPNPSCTFQCNGLSSIIRSVNGLRLSSHRPSIRDILMAGNAQHQCFAFACGHDFDPCWFLPSIIGLEVFECSNVMDLDWLGVSC